jgi:hypothetical protein
LGDSSSQNRIGSEQFSAVRVLMEEHTRSVRAVSLTGLALSLQFPSLGVIHKYLGLTGIIPYCVATTILILLLDKSLIKRFSSLVDNTVAIWLAALTFVAVLVGHLLMYPVANSGVVGGGSDADDALNIAVRELLHGRYPYYPVTYLGNAISPLPGAILLATPFVLLGNAAYQNIFWLTALFALACLHFKDVRLALLLIWACLILSPVVPSNIATGVDHLSNAIYVLVFMLFVVRVIPDKRSSPILNTALVLLLGIGLSSRSNFVLLLPLVFGTLVHKSGWRHAIRYTAITAGTVVAITAPFWLYDPQGFSPLTVQYSKGSQFGSILPYAGVIIPVAGGLLATLLAYRYSDGSLTHLLRNSALVQAFLVMCAVVGSVLQTGSYGLTRTSYGVFFLSFGVFASWTALYARAATPSSDSDHPVQAPEFSRTRRDQSGTSVTS